MGAFRHKTRTVKIGSVYIGARHPIAIQSMSKAKTSDVRATINQIAALTRAGCEIVRVAVKDRQDALAIRKIRAGIRIPLVADIHFDWRLALEAIDSGADKIRLNPGNIYKPAQVREVVSALKLAKIPLRIGVNSGSVKGAVSRKAALSDRLVASAQAYIRMVEKLHFYDMVISLKASNVRDTVEAYRKMAAVCDYPLHLGLTATGFPLQGQVKSSIAIGALLLEGIGDTIRISLTDQPEEEIRVAKAVLEALSLRHFGVQMISCPTCGRCEVDLIQVVRSLEKELAGRTLRPGGKPITLAVMGCVVNGPGEAKEADVGVAFGKKEGLLFKEGKVVKKIPFHNCVTALLQQIDARKRN
ncbi:MAG TPA: flavodoxin-dependent (E)-4-hydroxy-3-methylbut-2-enyl-diphosphate synthase [Patescibacteria group bacterium]|nr:flavodoxin-dependent (E)-4-hydroxy-3-methylbut-2-enyl-diphosphate synthase [Patescibacteria group bacterium]